MLHALPKLDPLLSDVQQAILSIMQDGAPTMAQVAMRIGLAELSPCAASMTSIFGVPMTILVIMA